jgi:glycosyltransferase involved in cell wall biosynthesis
LKVAIVNTFDVQGGAARAAYRIHHALRQHGIDSIMSVSWAVAGDWTVQGPTSGSERFGTRFRKHIDDFVVKSLRTDNGVLHSPAILPSSWAIQFGNLDVSIVHLNWICGGMLSVADIGRLTKPVVWTLHDMWAFCGAEHYTEDNRWREGYASWNRPAYESGFDLNRWTWQRKLRHWRNPMHIVAPSRWLAQCARQSKLMGEWPVCVIPNPIDTVQWRPIDKRIARELLHLPLDVPLLLFGAMGGAADPRKGFDLLQQGLSNLCGNLPGLELVVFGQLAPKVPRELGFSVHYTGHLHDEISLQLLYSAADVLVIPSRQDNLPNTGVESLACGTPVVAFDVGGLPDIVSHKQTGYLAQAFNVDDLARGIQWVLADSKRYTDLSVNARQDAVMRFAYPVVAKQYLQVYQAAADSSI